MRPPRVLLPLCLLLACSACWGSNTSSGMPKPPAFEPKNQSKCSVTRSLSEPLVVEWPSAARAKLEALAHRSLVVVRYQGCEMEVLPACVASGSYTYRALTRKQDRLTITTEDELYAQLPLGAVKLEGALQKSGALGVDMTIVGRWQAEVAPGSAQLQGDCKNATHVVTALTTGAFKFYAGASAAAQGGVGVPLAAAGGKSAAKNELLAQDGDDAACAASTSGDVSPPFGCGAILRLDVSPVSTTPTVTPACPSSTRWDGSRCVATAVTCPPGSTWNGSECAGTASTVAPQPAPPVEQGFYCYRVEKKSGSPRITSTCTGTKVMCEEGRAHDARVPEAKSVSPCEKRSTAACFYLRRSMHCYEAFGECSGVAEVWQPNEGCDTYRQFDMPTVRGAGGP
ncbi:MAG: hypothetical protein HY898_30090 [Deltaproteobacteria bacterium]|nr:hypothetical protein [Deltaproteobacteria bacterium]